ncbi:MAG: VOC family protein [Chloroflexi bacterium]|nr:VOC family protein [Chloroflexota bacterium]
MFDRLHHAGLAVGNLDQAKGIFADALGLRVDTTRSPYPGGRGQRGADPTDILDIPIGDSELELNAASSPGGGVHRFVESRGGLGALHHICLHTTNVADDVAHLRASGLTQIAASPEQLASGEPWQTVAFFHPRDTMGILLEIWPMDNHRVGDNSQGDRVFTSLHHLGVVTTDLEKARNFWCNTIGLRVDTLRSPIGRGRHDDSDNVTVLDIPIGASEIECVHPDDATSGTARFLEKYGARAGGTMHHIGLGTRDVKAAADRLESHGLKLIGRASTDSAWVHPKSAGGILIESVRDPR